MPWTRPLLCALALLLACGNAHGEKWRSTGGSFNFEATFEGESIEGAFRGFDVDFEFDPAAPADAQLKVTVRLGDADLGDPDMNAILFDPAWFDVGRFADAVYQSTAVQSRGDGEFTALGVLTLKGIEQPVTVPFTWQQNDAAARMHGEFSLQRTDFGVGSGEWSAGDTIGLDVRLAFDIALAAAE